MEGRGSEERIRGKEKRGESKGEERKRERKGGRRRGETKDSLIPVKIHIHVVHVVLSPWLT